MTVAWFGRTITLFPSSVPIIASQIISHGGASSPHRTVNKGLSHLAIPFGSSYLNIKFFHVSLSYSCSEVFTSTSCAFVPSLPVDITSVPSACRPQASLLLLNLSSLISLALSTGVPTWITQLGVLTAFASQYN